MSPPSERERASEAGGLIYNEIETRLALNALGMLRMVMPAFSHRCRPCPACNPPDPDCDVCGGKSTPCECEATYDHEADRRHRLAREEGGR